MNPIPPMRRVAASMALLACAHALAAPPADDPDAPNAGMRALNLGLQRDAQHNQNLTAAVSLPVGRRAWVQVGAGQSRGRESATEGRSPQPTQVSAGGGVIGSSWQASVNASQRQAGPALRQTDLSASADWRPLDGVTVGVDASHRNARLRGTAPSAPGGAAQPVAQQVQGNGLGVHGAVAVTSRLTLQAATVHNRYRTRTQQTDASGGTVGGLLPVNPLLNRVSTVNRDEAALDRSRQLGATYRVSDRVALTGEWLQDQVHDGGSLRSLQMKAAINAGAGWTVTPGLGQSRGPQGERVAYGLLGARYSW